jgi:hypothetical protein
MPAYTCMAMYLAAQKTPDVSLLDRLSITLFMFDRLITSGDPLHPRDILAYLEQKELTEATIHLHRAGLISYLHRMSAR